MHFPLAAFSLTLCLCAIPAHQAPVVTSPAAHNDDANAPFQFQASHAHLPQGMTSPIRPEEITSFQEMVMNRPAARNKGQARRYRTNFASHPAIVKINIDNANQDERSRTKAAEDFHSLRGDIQGTTTKNNNNNKPSWQRKMTASMDCYFKDKKVDEKLIKTIHGYTLLATRQKQRHEALQKAKEVDLLGFRQRKKQSNIKAKRIRQLKDEKGDIYKPLVEYLMESYSKEELESMSAMQVASASKAFESKYSRHTYPKALRGYLLGRKYDLSDVNAVLGLRDFEMDRQRRQQSSARRKQRQVASQSHLTSSSSPMPPDKRRRIPLLPDISKNDIAIPPATKTQQVQHYLQQTDWYHTKHL